MESTSHASSFNTLLDSIDLKTTGIIWTPKGLNLDDSELLYELDYFFDGTILRGLHHHNKEQDFSLFTTKNFGNDLKMGLIHPNDNLESNLKIFIDLVSKPNLPFKIILILDKPDKIIEKQVEKLIKSLENCTLQKIYF